MRPEVLALLGALFFASSNVSTKKGLQDTSAIAGLLVSLVVGSGVIWVVLLADHPESVSFSGTLLFVLGGFFGPALGRGLAVGGIDSLGASVSIPVQTTIYPIAGISIGVLGLGEDLELAQIVALPLILAGIWLVTARYRKDNREAREELDSQIVEELNVRERLRSFTLLFPIVAGFSYAVGDLFRKQGIETLPHALFGTAVGTATALVVWGGVAGLSSKVRSRLTFGRGIRWFALAGIFATFALLSIILGLQDGDISQIAPVIAVQPVLVALLSRIFLRTIERVDFRIIAGSVLAALGVIVLTVS